jgi:chromosome segregation ATPase
MTEKHEQNVVSLRAREDTSIVHLKQRLRKRIDEVQARMGVWRERAYPERSTEVSASRQKALQHLYRIIEAAEEVDNEVAPSRESLEEVLFELVDTLNRYADLFNVYAPAQEDTGFEIELLLQDVDRAQEELTRYLSLLEAAAMQCERLGIHKGFIESKEGFKEILLKKFIDVQRMQEALLTNRNRTLSSAQRDAAKKFFILTDTLFTRMQGVLEPVLADIRMQS